MLKILKHIVQTVSSAKTLPEALDLIIEHVIKTLHADSSSIFLVDDLRGEYLLFASVGLNPAMIGKARIKFGEGLIGLVGERGEPINVDNASENPNYFYLKNLGEDAYKAFLGVPIIYQGELLGILVVQQRAARFFSEEEEALLVTLSAQLSGVIAHAFAKGVLQDIKKRQGKKRNDILLFGLPGAPGVAIGEAVVMFPSADLESIPDSVAHDIQSELKLFQSALLLVREEITVLQIRAKKLLSVSESILFDVYLRLLNHQTLIHDIETEIKAGQWAQGALSRVIKKHILQFESLDDVYLRERASDIRDLGRRILSHIQARKREKNEFPNNTILVGEEVTAALLMEIPREYLAGVVSARGSANSHVAIIARALGLPTVMGVSGISIAELNGQELIVDGYDGQIYVAPSLVIKKTFHQLALEEAQLDDELESLRELPAETQDGHIISLYVNAGIATESGLSLSVGAEGVGLYRTEMPFMVRDRFPSEEEQRAMYRQLLRTFAPRPVVMRTLDIGGDKTLPYFSIQEDNPFLGWRGIRVTLDHPEIFLQQVRAMLHASVDIDNLSILLPMISSTREVIDAKKIIFQAYTELLEEGLKIKKPAIGLMIEVPATIHQAYELAKLVDFLSVGSNDLIQFLLAVDRNNSRVANLYDGLHPGVLRALNQVVKACHRARKKISICGELASDPIAVVLLLAMGFDVLSMNARSLPRVKWVVRKFSLKNAQQLLKEVLIMNDPVSIRNHIEVALEQIGLGSLIRAGKS